MSAPLRRPAAPAFYRGDVRAQVSGFVQGFAPPAVPVRVTAAAVPHAGWVFSGRVAARVFETIRVRSDPATLILLGAVHRWGVRRPTLDPAGAWSTPAGPLPVDEALAARLADALGEALEVDADAHADEHSLEVQCPMIRLLMPDARIVPIAVPPSGGAARFGALLADAIAPDEPVVVVASTDLTHYGRSYGTLPAGEGPSGRRWMEENDARMLALCEAVEADAIVPESAERQNACGAGALAAAAGYARARGVTRGHVLEYTTSYRELPDDVFRMGVGYGGVLW
jgi:AmmeMemoRadiSam system protein B